MALSGGRGKKNGSAKPAVSMAALRAELRVAKKKIRELEKELGRSERIRLDKTELVLLDNIARCDIDNAFPVDFAAGLNLAKPRLDYHLQRLVDAAYIKLLFRDSALGDNFAVTQKGRKALVKKHLL